MAVATPDPVAVAYEPSPRPASPPAVATPDPVAVAYRDYFDAAKGFKPAQRSLTRVFLQMAGSLECYGSPEPYLRHVVAEGARIDAKYKLATGHGSSYRPAYFTDAYLEKLVANWKQMEPTLKLESFARSSGQNIRYAIMGGWNKSAAELAADEDKLTDAEKATYQKLVEKDYFAKSDLPAVEAFYKGPYDKLSDSGRQRMSERTWRGTKPSEQREEAIKNSKSGTFMISVFNEHQSKTLAFLESSKTEKSNSDTLVKSITQNLRLDEQAVEWQKLPAEKADALRYAQAIKAAYVTRAEHLHKQPISKEQADNIEAAMFSMIDALAAAAQMEFEAGLAEDYADKKLKPSHAP